MKTYTGYRLGNAPEGYVKVHEADGTERELDLRLDLRLHGDTPAWGYGGSGPAQLALGLAADVLGDDERAMAIYQPLKFRVIGRLPQDGWSMTEEEILAHIEGLEQERGSGSEPGV